MSYEKALLCASSRKQAAMVSTLNAGEGREGEMGKLGHTL